MLQINNLKKSYGRQEIFSDFSFSIGDKQKIGVIGKNGAGKSTLFRLILGDEPVEDGQIIIHPDTRLGRVDQEDDWLADENSLDYLIRRSGREVWDVKKLAGKFEIDQTKFELRANQLSGGWRMRLKLVAMLLYQPNLFLLDEPTNYLDLNTLLLLENYLKSYQGSFMIISHDREFIKKTCQETLEIYEGGYYHYTGPLEEYLAFKEQKMSTLIKQNKGLERQQEHLKEFVDRFRASASKAKQAQAMLRKIEKLESKRITIEHEAGITRIIMPVVMKRKNLALRVKKLSIGYSANEYKPSPLARTGEGQGEGEGNPTNDLIKNKQVLSLSTSNLTQPSPSQEREFYGVYQDENINKHQSIVTNINFEMTFGERLLILGQNGQGKTTLLKTLAGHLKPTAGSFHWFSTAKLAYHAQDNMEILDPSEQIWAYLRRMASPDVKTETVLKMAGDFLFDEEAQKKPIAVLSGGEKSRLQLAGILLSKPDILIMDEPTSHLDFETVEALGQSLMKFNGAILFTSHDRTFANLLATGLIEINNGVANRRFQDYEDYIEELESQLYQEKETVVKQTNNEDKKLLYEEKKAEQKKLASLEKKLIKLRTQHQELMEYFTNHPTNYHAEKMQILSELNREIVETENEWLEIAAK